MTFKSLLRTVTDYFYPPMCMSCGKIIETNEILCGGCKENLTFVDNGKRCSNCGKEKPDCDCRFRIFYFNSIVSPWFNENSAKNIVYRYKLGGKRFYKHYIAENMVDCFYKEYSDIKFDAIVPVPATFRSKRNRGFDHTAEIAYEISKKIAVPVRNDIIGVKQLKRSQHRSSFKQRFKNVNNKYYILKKVDLNNVLLVDDIKTTGATLNACSRQLLFAGVRRVSCLTALVSADKNESQKKFKKV